MCPSGEALMLSVEIYARGYNENSLETREKKVIGWLEKVNEIGKKFKVELSWGSDLRVVKKKLEQKPWKWLTKYLRIGLRLEACFIKKEIYS